MAWVRRTLILVPSGTITAGLGFGAAGAAGAAATGAGFGAGGGGGAGFGAETSTATVSSIGTSDTLPSSSSRRTALLSAPMNVPVITLPDRRRTRSADSDAAAIMISAAL